MNLLRCRWTIPILEYQAFSVLPRQNARFPQSGKCVPGMWRWSKLIALIVARYVTYSPQHKAQGVRRGHPIEVGPIKISVPDLARSATKTQTLEARINMLDYYNILLLSRHPIFQPFRKILQLSRPTFQIWTDASGQGYGAHLGPAKRPIALYQHKRLP